jgi:hypothetical protein
MLTAQVWRTAFDDTALGLLQKYTNVTEVPAASFITVDDSGSRHLWNVDLLVRNYTAQHPRR